MEGRRVGSRQGRWRLFRHDAGRAAGPPPWAYVALFAACMGLGVWSASTFNAVVVWPANGVVLAALLQLHRRPAIAVLATCFAINLATNVVRGDPAPFFLANAMLNMVQVVTAAVLARRFCGAALDMRRSRRLVRFILLAATPAVALSTIAIVTLAITLRDYSAIMVLFQFSRLFSMEMLGLLMVTPSLLLLARAHRFRGSSRARPWEKAGLMALLAATTLIVFNVGQAPLLFAVLPVLTLVAFRLSPPWTAGALVMVTVLSGLMTLTGRGPIFLTPPLAHPDLAGMSPLVRQMAPYHLFLLAAALSALPVSTAMTERRRLIASLHARTLAAQAARRRAEASDAAKSRFLALMSHEMRTPLNGISGYADLLAQRADIADEARAQVESIRRSGEALLMLVEDVLEFSRGGEEARVEPLCAGTLLRKAAAPAMLAAEAKGLAFSIEVTPAAGARFLGDRRRMRQALHHVIGNAVKFTDRGEVRIVADHDGDALIISVSDTGRGIAPELHARLFDAFSTGDDSITRDHVGAGVGLAVVGSQVARLGGDITVRSAVGQGSTFVLRLPVARDASDAAPASGFGLPLSPPPAHAEPACAALRVLVVDDHPVNREMLRLMLTLVGCETMEAADGVEAVEAARQAAFDLILMDVRMPRMDGLAATAAIRALPAPACETPILAVTADAMPEDVARSMAAGMDGHLAKPVTQPGLYAAMEQVLRTAAAEPRTAVA